MRKFIKELSPKQEEELIGIFIKFNELLTNGESLHRSIKINFDDDPELLELLELTYETGLCKYERYLHRFEIIKQYDFSLAHLLAFYDCLETNKPDILKLKDKNKNTVAHYLAKQSLIWTTDDEDILELTNNKCETVAQVLFENDKIPEIKNLFENKTTNFKNLPEYRKIKKILIVSDNFDGNTLLHKLASKYGWVPDLEMLKIANKNGWTIAHSLCMSDKLFQNLTPELKQSLEKLLTVSDIFGQTVALILARYQPWWTTNNERILKIRFKKGRVSSTAHQLAYRGDWTTNNKRILKLVEENGDTVAHLIVKYNQNNYIFTDPEILKLKNKQGKTVACEQVRRYGWIPDLNDPYIKNICEPDIIKIHMELINYWLKERDENNFINNAEKLHEFFQFCEDNYGLEYNKDLQQKVKKALEINTAKAMIKNSFKKSLNKNKEVKINI